MRRAPLAIAVVLAILGAIVALRSRRRPPAARHPPPTTANRETAAPEPRRPAPPLRLPAATVRADATAAAGEFGGRVLSTADGRPIANAALTFLH